MATTRQVVGSEDKADGNGWTTDADDQSLCSGNVTLTPDCSSGEQPQAAVRGGTEDKQKWLAATIEREIVPRLLMAHRQRVTGAAVLSGEDHPREEAPQADLGSHRGSAVSAADLARFTKTVLDDDDAAIRQQIDSLQARGVERETLFLDLLAPAARALGTGWEDDVYSFSDVTIGLTRLHRLIHSLGAGADMTQSKDRAAHRILLVPAPGEQHTFGLLMVAEFFRLDGWSVWDEPSVSMETIKDLVNATAYDVVGLSVSCEVALHGLHSVITTLKSESCNPNVKVMVGGQIFADNPTLVTRVGGDLSASNAAEAVSRANEIMAQETSRTGRAV